MPIDGEPLADGLGAVWSASSAGLVRLSLPTGRAHVVLRDPTDDVALSSGCVYALAGARSELVEVDPHSLKMRRRWAVGQSARSMVAGQNDVYIAHGGDPVVIDRVNLQGGAITRAAIRSANGLASDRSIALGGGRLWVIDGGSLYWLDPARLSVLGSRSLAASDIWFGDGSLWAASDTPDGGVERIDPATTRIIARSGADAIQIAFSSRAVWLSAASGPTALDPSTARTIAKLPPAQVPTNGSAGIAVVGNEIWTTYPDIGKLQRLQPTR